MRFGLIFCSDKENIWILKPGSSLSYFTNLGSHLQVVHNVSLLPLVSHYLHQALESQIQLKLNWQDHSCLIWQCLAHQQLNLIKLLSQFYLRLQFVEFEIVDLILIHEQLKLLSVWPLLDLFVRFWFASISVNKFICITNFTHSRSKYYFGN